MGHSRPLEPSQYDYHEAMGHRLDYCAHVTLRVSTSLGTQGDFRNGTKLIAHSTCTSSLYTMTYDQITEEFHCSKLIATLGLSLFIMGLGLGPMFLAPLSEVSAA